ncbi:MAG: S-methyl-5-thioribose-1-phosphate isomerase [Moraxellaceae bacterium]|nr:MAG: S-methyl-5-thioribose-1-phosphate isomerase [Moraxellaceae bacterium]
MRDLRASGIKVEQQALWILDQRKLPREEIWRLCVSAEEMVEAIQSLQVRGAPLIGVAAGLMVASLCVQGAEKDQVIAGIKSLASARPTAVNLAYCMKRMSALSEQTNWREAMINEAQALFDEDVELCNRMAGHGELLVQPGDRLLTHCNAGSLATVGVGTAIGVITEAWRQSKNIKVWVSETRPLLQGGRLTAWEMEQAGIPYDIICDNMAASLMAQNKVDKIFVGSDRIASNGDFANKIGTYSLAVLAHYHQVPFYVVAPHTTLDLECKTGDDIPIEQRDALEVKGVNGGFGELQWSPEQATAYNPAFDVTPAELVSGWVLDSGVYSLQEVQAGALCRL